jgi:hypothetical protein
MSKTTIILLVVAGIALLAVMFVFKKNPAGVQAASAPVGIPRQTNLGVLTGAINATKGIIDSISSAFTKQGSSVAVQQSDPNAMGFDDPMGF